MTKQKLTKKEIEQLEEALKLMPIKRKKTTLDVLIGKTIAYMILIFIILALATGMNWLLGLW